MCYELLAASRSVFASDADADADDTDPLPGVRRVVLVNS